MWQQQLRISTNKMVQNRKQLKIAVLHGGFEPERYVSDLTGENIYKALKNAGYKNTRKLFVDKNVIKNLEKTKPDFAYIAMYCKWGEDGIIQSLLEIMGIPYSGCDVETSSLCKNKYLFNKFVIGCGLDAPETYFYGNLDEYRIQKPQIVYPCIVKAIYQGYSLGTSYTNQPEDVEHAITKAFQFSTRITIQEYIDGKELTVGIIDTPTNGRQVLPIIELSFSGHKIQDTEVKDNPKLIKEKLPAKLTNNLEQKLKEQSLELFIRLGCYGVSRFDIRLKKKKFYFLENNTCPGIISYEMSDLPKQLKAVKISLEEFVDNMVYLGLIRPEKKLEYIC